MGMLRTTVLNKDWFVSCAEARLPTPLSVTSGIPEVSVVCSSRLSRRWKEDLWGFLQGHKVGLEPHNGESHGSGARLLYAMLCRAQFFCSPGGAELIGTWMLVTKSRGHEGLGIWLHLACELSFTWGSHSFLSLLFNFVLPLHLWLYWGDVGSIGFACT